MLEKTEHDLHRLLPHEKNTSILSPRAQLKFVEPLKDEVTPPTALEAVKVYLDLDRNQVNKRKETVNESQMSKKVKRDDLYYETQPISLCSTPTACSQMYADAVSSRTG